MRKFRYKMTPEAFIGKVIELYQLARIPQYFHPKVRRGRSHPIPGKVEDLVAAFLGFNLISDCDIYVDQPLRLTNLKKTIYPDIALIKRDQLEQIVDVKMDLGWNRYGLGEFCREKSSLVKQLRKSSGTLTDGITKEKRNFQVAPNCRYHILIISGENISDSQLESSLKMAKQYEPETFTYLLSQGVSPNQYGITSEQLLGDLKIFDDSFEQFFQNLKADGIK